MDVGEDLVEELLAGSHHHGADRQLPVEEGDQQVHRSLSQAGPSRSGKDLGFRRQVQQMRGNNGAKAAGLVQTMRHQFVHGGAGNLHEGGGNHHNKGAGTIEEVQGVGAACFVDG